MIIKKIRRRTTSTSGSTETTYMGHLSRYITRADSDDLSNLIEVCDDAYLRELARYAVAEGREGKAVAVGSINLHGQVLADWEAEMTALLHRCPDAAGAVDHWVFSWPDGERPTVPELEQVFTTFLKCQGVDRCKAIWGYHGDTDNAHGHLEVVRIDPVSGARFTGGDGWDIDTAHRAKAIIESEFPHWKPEGGSRYVVQDEQLVDCATGNIIGRASDPPGWTRNRASSSATTERLRPNQRAIDAASVAYEEATGFMSRKRIAVELAVPILLAAATLDEAHRALAEQGIELRRERSGAAYIIDGKPIKASIDRRTSHDAIVARYGEPLTPCPYPVSPRSKRKRWPDDHYRRSYYAARRSHDEQRASIAVDIRTALGANVRGGPAAAALSAASEKASFPAFEAWRQGATPPDASEVMLGAMNLNEIAVDSYTTLTPVQMALQGYRATSLGNRVIYRATGDHGNYPSFIDLGSRILVHDGNDPAAVRASLLLMASRYPGEKLNITGNRAFKKLALQIASKEQIRIVGYSEREQSPQAASTKRAIKLPGSSNSHDLQKGIGLKAVQQKQTSRNAALTMLSNDFHGSDWDASEFWGPSFSGSLISQAPSILPSEPSKSLESKEALGSAKTMRRFSAARAAAMGSMTRFG